MWSAPCLQPGLDLAPIDLPTQTGDVTIDLSCTRHMSQSPVKRTRKVLYTGFGQTAADAELARVNRERMGKVRSKTHTTMSQQPGYLGDSPRRVRRATERRTRRVPDATRSKCLV